jgi:hypothetical protein
MAHGNCLASLRDFAAKLRTVNGADDDAIIAQASWRGARAPRSRPEALHVNAAHAPDLGEVAAVAALSYSQGIAATIDHFRAGLDAAQADAAQLGRAELNAIDIVCGPFDRDGSINLHLLVAPGLTWRTGARRGVRLAGGAAKGIDAEHREQHATYSLMEACR